MKEVREKETTRAGKLPDIEIEMEIHITRPAKGPYNSDAPALLTSLNH